MQHTLTRLVQEVAQKTLPYIIRDRFGPDFELDETYAKEFFEIAFDRNAESLERNDFEPEIIPGSAFSIIAQMGANRPPVPVTWYYMKSACVKQFHNLKRNQIYHQSYYRLFYEASTAMSVGEITMIILKKFAEFLKFEGSILFSDEDFAVFFQEAQIKIEGQTVDEFLSDVPDLHTQFGKRYKEQIANWAGQTLLDLSRGLLADDQDRGGPAALLTITSRVYKVLENFNQALTFSKLKDMYPANLGTSTNPIQRMFDSVLSGVLTDITADIITPLIQPPVHAQE